MTQAADLIRDRRRHWATPGGSHDRLVRVLATWMPAGIGMIAAIMVLAPIVPRGEISFLLDRNKVAITRERLRVDNAMYRGVDKANRAFEVKAGSAVQPSAKVPVVELSDLAASVQLNSGPARFTAPEGIYDFKQDHVRVSGNVLFSAADGYSMATRNVTIDLKDQVLVGDGGVSGAIPSGEFSADRIVADLDARTVALEGNAHLRMTPGKLRKP